MTETKTDVVLLIERVRRNMPLNRDVHAVCDLLERALLAAKANTVSNVSSDVSNVSTPVSGGVSKPKADRRTYMRDLMRRRRAASKPKRINPLDAD